MFTHRRRGRRRGRRQNVVVDERGDTGGGADRRPGRAAQDQVERLVRFHVRVAFDGDGGGLGGLARGEGERAARGGVVRAAGRATVAGCVVHRDRRQAGLREGHGGRDGPGPVALVLLNVADRHRGGVVVDERGNAGGRVDRRPGRAGQDQVEGLVRFHLRV